MRLAEVLDAYAASRDIESPSLKPIRAAIRSLSLFLGEPARLRHLTAQSFNAWLKHEIERVQRRTAKNYRASILTLWKWAFDEEELTEVAPLRLRRIKAPWAPVEAYTTQEVEALLAACDLLSNKFVPFRMVSRKLLYRALIMTAWHTGFRPNDLMRLRWRDIAENGCVRIVQHKTRREITRWIDSETLGACEAIHGPSETVFGVHTSVETWREVHSQLKRIAGIKRGSPKWIRRAMATAIAVRYGDDAAGRALGHKTAGLARQHYIDQSQLPASILRPPRLKRLRKPR